MWQRQNGHTSTKRLRTFSLFFFLFVCCCSPVAIQLQVCLQLFVQDKKRMQHYVQCSACALVAYRMRRQTLNWCRENRSAFVWIEHFIITHRSLATATTDVQNKLRKMKRKYARGATVLNKVKFLSLLAVYTLSVLLAFSHHPSESSS